jgi:hypothetical protein
MAVKDWMPPEIQITQIRERFRKLNPDIDPALIDFESFVTDQSYNANLMDLAAAYPQYQWFEKEVDVREARRTLQQDYENRVDYNLNALIEHFDVPEELVEELKEHFNKLKRRWQYETRKLETSHGVKQEYDKRIRSLNAEIEMLREKLEEEKEQAGPRIPREIVWTNRFENELKDLWTSILVKGGVSYRHRLSVFRQLIRDLKEERRLTEEEVKELVRRSADELVGMYSPIAEKFRFEPITEKEEREEKPEKTDGITYPFRFEEGEEAETYEGGYEVTPPPTRDNYAVRFPRRPSGSEIDQFWNKYKIDLLYCGKDLVPSVRRKFNEFFADLTFKSWDAEVKAYQNLINSICAGKDPEMPLELITTGIYKGAGELTTTQCDEIVGYIVASRNREPRPDVEEVAAFVSTIVGKTTVEAVRNCLKTFIDENKEAREKGEPLPHGLLVILPQDYINSLLEET